MTARVVFVAVFICAAIAVACALLLATGEDEMDRWTPATAPGSEPVIYQPRSIHA